ncbi:hypothetical protein [Sulfurimonas sp.]|uniref:hypothetical protein n=1 Tax=Sulfurimonas sp. TaxID=2022749 RepID=UPI003D12194F
MDVNYKLKQLQNSKVAYTKELSEQDFIYVIYMFNKDSVVYIGKSSNYIKYLSDRSEKLFFTHYAIEEVNTKEADNLIAEMVFKLNPMGNQYPKSTKYISHNQAKIKYNLNKDEFKKLWKQQTEQLQYESQMILEVEVIQNYTGQLQPKHPYLPKEGELILLIKDEDEDYYASWNSYSDSIAFDLDGNEIDVKVKSYTKDELQIIDQKYKYKSYEVDEIIDHETFTAYNVAQGVRITLKVEQRGKTWEHNYRIDY